MSIPTGTANVGIGTTAPLGNLSVIGNGRLITIGDSGGANVPEIKATNTAGTGEAYLKIAAYEHRLFTGGTQRLTINNSGNVGIGVTAPASLLHVAGTVQVGVDDTGHDVKFFGATSGKSLLWDESADSLIVTGTTTLVGTTNLDAVDIDGATQIDGTVTVGVNDTGYDVKFFGATAGSYMLWDESTDDLILGGAARMGIGVAEPAYDLEINDASDPTIRLYDVRGGTQADVRIISQGSTGLGRIGTYSAKDFTLMSNSAERVRITSAGNVGIGTTAPSEKLEVAGNIILDAASAHINIKSGGGGTSGAIQWTFNTDSTEYGSISLPYDTRATLGLIADTDYPISLQSTGGSGFIRFQTSTAERMRILAGGNVGIGVTAPASLLHVAGTVQVGVNDTGHDVKLFGATSGAYMLWDESADDLKLVGAAGLTVAGNSVLASVDVTGLATAATFEPDGDTAAGDNAAIGYTAAEGLILTGQGSTSDITLKNDTDATVFTVPTGTDDILFPDSAKAMFGAGSDLQIFHDGSHSAISEVGTGNLYIQSNGTQIILQPTTGESGIVIDANAAVNLYHNNIIKLATAANGLSVTGAATFAATNGSTDGVSIKLGSGRSGNGYAYLDLIGDATYTAYGLRIIRNNGGANTSSVIEHKGTGNLSLSCNEAGAITFDTTNTERLRIDAAGNVLVGATAAPSASVSGVLISSPDYQGSRWSRASGTTTTNMIAFSNANGDVGMISTSGSTTTYATSSDYRLKNTITPMIGALARVAALKPVTFKWTADNSDGEGFIAHELQSVVPDCVSGEKDAVDDEGNPQYQGVDTSFLVATLTAAIQEQQALIEALTTRITTLEG